METPFGLNDSAIFRCPLELLIKKINGFGGRVCIITPELEAESNGSNPAKGKGHKEFLSKMEVAGIPVLVGIYCHFRREEQFLYLFTGYGFLT